MEKRKLFTGKTNLELKKTMFAAYRAANQTRDLDVDADRQK